LAGQPISKGLPRTLCEGTMIRISLAYVYNFAVNVEPLVAVQPEEKISARWFDLIVAQSQIEQLLEQSVFSGSLLTSRNLGNQLVAKIKRLAEEEDKEKVFGPYEQVTLSRMFNEFKTVLLAELETLNAHFVTQKRGYDTNVLMGWAERIFPPDLPAKAPDAVFDIREAGKCVAFELPTAAGFHLHRANEAILHRYYDAVTGGKPRPGSRNIGDYLAKLKEHGVGDPRLLATLKDLKDLHRNPLIHPDQTLESIDEAIGLMNGIHNAVVYMLKVIPEPAALPEPPT